MDILLTNDDGYMAKGLEVMAEILREFGDVTVIAPKKHQSGMSMAVSMGGQAIAYKDLGVRNGVHRAYLDGTPVTCVKFALNTVFSGKKPDVLVSGINHGSNAASAVCYSGTLGAAAEAALNGIPAIGVSLDTSDPDADFGQVKEYFPGIFRKLTATRPGGDGIYYNVNFPSGACGPAKGIRVASQGIGKWVRELAAWDREVFTRLRISEEEARKAVENAAEGERLYAVVGDFADDSRNPEDADHRLNQAGFITIVPHKIDCTDYEECRRLKAGGLEQIFK